MKFITFLLFSINCFAFKLIPMTATINPMQSKSFLFKVKNDKNTPMAIQVAMAKRVMDQFGKETHPKTNDFNIYPPQFVVMPGKTQVIKVTWKKDSKIDKEIPYRIIAEQVPVELDEKKVKSSKTNIKILLKYIGALYIAPVQGSSKIIVKSANIKNNILKLKVHNKGNIHQVLRKLELILNNGKKEALLRPSSLKGVASENILAGQTRIFNIDLKKYQFKNGKVKAKLKFE